MRSAVNKNIRRTLFANLPKVADQWFARHFDRVLLQTWKIYGTESSDLSWLKAKYVTPVLRLLGEYLGTGKEKYLALYLDERLRYAPHRLDKAQRVEFFKQLVPEDEAEILELFNPSSVEFDRLKELLTSIHTPLLNAGSRGSLQILGLGDCLLNEVRIFLAQQCRARGFDADMRSMYFSASENAELSANDTIEYLKNNKVDALTISFFTFDGMRSFSRLMQEYPQLSNLQITAKVDNIIHSVREFLLALREHTQAPFIVHNASGLPISRARKHLPFLAPIPARKKKILNQLNGALVEVLFNISNCILVDEQGITLTYGVSNMAANIIPLWLRKDAFFHTSAFGEKVAECYSTILRALAQLGKAKVLLVDFDNTLWDGVMADGAVQQFYERQVLLRDLKNAGILLVAVSKNSPENIRWEEMVLKRDDFALLKINWNLKAQSVEEAARELNLGMDSFVLIDDNPAERDLVTNAHPQVKAFDATDPGTWADLRLMLKFPNTQATEEARARTRMYQEQTQRQATLRSDLDYPQMMKSLELKLLFRRAENSDATRLYELINRTNQFNTTTIRLSKGEVKAYLENETKQVWVAELADKFGKYGIIGVVLGSADADGWLSVESFIMSCRAMGYRVEQQMLSELSNAQSATVKGLIGHYIDSGRNAPCRDLFKSCGFESVSETDWVYDFKDGRRIPAVEWISVTRR